MTILEVAGRSMLPWLRPGDLVYIRRAKPVDIRWGDVVLYARRIDGRAALKVHRVLWRQRRRDSYVFWTKGDRELNLDGVVPGHAVLGVVFARERKGGTFLLDSIKGRALNIAAAVIGLAAALLRIIWGLARRGSAAIVEKLRPDEGKELGWRGQIFHILRAARASSGYWPCRAIARRVPHWKPLRWYFAPDRFRPVPSCPVPGSGQVVLSGRIDRNLEISGDISLQGDVEIAEWATLRIGPGSSIRAGRGDFLSIRRGVGGQAVELCQAGLSHLIARGRLIVSGEPERLVVAGGAGFGGIIGVGRGRIGLRGMEWKDCPERAVAAVDSSRVRLDRCRFIGGTSAIYGGGRARVEVSGCRFKGQRILAAVFHDRSAFLVRAAPNSRMVAPTRKLSASLPPRILAAIQKSGFVLRASLSTLGWTMVLGWLRPKLSAKAGGFRPSVFSGSPIAIALQDRARANVGAGVFLGQSEACVRADGVSRLRVSTSFLGRSPVGVKLLGNASAILLSCRGSRLDSAAFMDGSSRLTAFRVALSRSLRGLLIKDEARALLVACGGSDFQAAPLLVQGGRMDVIGGEWATRDREALRVESGSVHMVATSLTACETAVRAFGTARVFFAVGKLSAPVGVRAEDSSRASGFGAARRETSVGTVSIGGAAAVFRLDRSRPQWLSSAAGARVCDTIDFPRSFREKFFRLLAVVRRAPMGRIALRWPYSVCLRVCRRLLSPYGTLWLRRSWARGEAEAGFSDLDLMLCLDEAGGDAALEARRLGAIRDRWLRLRRFFPFLGEAIVAESRDVNFYIRYGYFRSWEKWQDWKPVNAGRAAPWNGEPAAESRTREALDRWSDGLEAYLRIIATAADRTAVGIDPFWRHRAGRAWTRVWRLGADPLGFGAVPPPLPDDPWQACAAALVAMDRGAAQVLNAMGQDEPGALENWSLNLDSAKPILEEGPWMKDIIAVLEDPGYLSYFVARPSARIEPFAEMFRASFYLRARHDFLRCLPAIVTPDCLSLALCGPHRDWPYQSGQSAAWPKYGFAAGGEGIELRRWASESGGEVSGLERELLLECLACLRLHWRGRLMDLVGSGHACAYLSERLPVLAGEAEPSPSCFCSEDPVRRAERIVSWINAAVELRSRQGWTRAASLVDIVERRDRDADLDSSSKRRAGRPGAVIPASGEDA